MQGIIFLLVESVDVHQLLFVGVSPKPRPVLDNLVGEISSYPRKPVEGCGICSVEVQEGDVDVWFQPSVY